MISGAVVNQPVRRLSYTLELQYAARVRSADIIHRCYNSALRSIETVCRAHLDNVGAGVSKQPGSPSNDPHRRTDFVPSELDPGAYQRGVTVDPGAGNPTDNALIEAFNSRFRAVCLNAHWFLMVAGA